MSNEIKLKSIATFQPGIYIRENNYADEPAAYLLSLRDFDDQLRYRGTAARIDPEKVRDKYILTETDLLFSTRQKFNAFLLPTPTDDPISHPIVLPSSAPVLT